MGLAEDFIIAENAKPDNASSFLGRDPAFILVKDLQYKKQDHNDSKPFIIRPSLAGQVLAGFLLAFGLYAFLILARMLSDTSLLPLKIGAFLFIIAWIGVLVWFKFLNRRFVYNITLSPEGIRLHNVFLPWNTVLEYLIMLKGWGRNRESFLVLFTEDRAPLIFNISYFNRSPENILWLIHTYHKKYSQRARIIHSDKADL